MSDIFTVNDLNLWYGAAQALHHVSLSVPEKSITALIGPSGCGKSTFLKTLDRMNDLIPGVRVEGQVLYRGEDIYAPSVDVNQLRREVGMVFQEYSLLPWRTVEDNVALGLEFAGKGREERRKVAREYLELVDLAAFARAMPHELSGGMRQRVAIARALANRPDVLLMDEPFGALDAHTRILLQRELLRIWQHHKTTILFVTHGVDEAVYLADRVVVMSARPGTVRAVVPVDIPRPRHRGDPEYARLTASILEMLDTSAGTGRDERKNDAGGCPCR